jgi:hypothetical protein
VVVPFGLPHVSPLNAFPLILMLSLVGCLAGTLLTKPDDPEVLASFYRRVRPWGFWGPVLERARRDDPALQPNREFGRDMLNVAVGVCWQTSLVVLPIGIVLRKLDIAAGALAVAALTTAILKRTWYDRLESREAATALSASAAVPSNRAAPGRC